MAEKCRYMCKFCLLPGPSCDIIGTQCRNADTDVKGECHNGRPNAEVYQPCTGRPEEEGMEKLGSQSQTLAKDTIVHAISSHRCWAAAKKPLERNSKSRSMR